jgi:hypothetical protein
MKTTFLKILYLFVLAKCMDHYVLLVLAQCDTIYITFNLLTNRTRFDTFAFIVNFLDQDWVPCHVTIDLFEVINTYEITSTKLMKPLLAKFQLNNKVLACVKDKGKNLATLNFSLSIVVSCDVFQLEKGPNSLRCTKILSHHHLFLFFLPSPYYHVKTHLWMIMMESKIVMV